MIQTPLLDTINDPRDLRRLPVAQLKQLADELREKIIDVVSQTGGHLAPSLGTVELTIALHYIFNTPQDKLIWDVGHQTYAHKLLTGRRGTFSTIRQFGGLSGFPKRSESPYDTFDVGHAGTSISAALGMAVARDSQQQDHDVVAVIGDGSLTSGLALEGLNNAGMEKRDLIIVVNDNKMSISKNVGAISSYLTRIITDPTFNRLKNDVWELTGKMAGLGQQVRRLVQRIEVATKLLVIPGRLFEDLGFQYLGPIDGHNLSELTATFTAIKKMKGPILVHVLTTKGKGYKHAEDNAEKFHGVGVFEKATGNAASRPVGRPSYGEVFGRTLVEMGRQEPRLVGITAAMADGTGLKYFRDEFPGRFYDIGIAEQHAVTFAAGLAAQGMRPVVAIYSSFLQRSYDQIVHDVALQNLPVILVLDRAGLVGEDGPTHHGVFDLSYLRHIPNMVVMAPRDTEELTAMLWAALAYTSGPVAIRYPRGTDSAEAIPIPRTTITIGQAEVVGQGADPAILAIGKMVHIAYNASLLLQAKGITPQVVNMRFIKPLDHELLEKICGRTKRIICLEDNAVAGGFGSAVMEWLHEHGHHDHRIQIMGLPDRFMEHGPLDQLFRLAGLDAASVAERVARFMRS